jgi:hypothetical protein
VLVQPVPVPLLSQPVPVPFLSAPVRWWLVLAPLRPAQVPKQRARKQRALV